MEERGYLRCGLTMIAVDWVDGVGGEVVEMERKANIGGENRIECGSC
jgi:hypothetical protein